MHQILIGVDEAGRGPLAGPVSVGVVAVPYDFDVKLAFPGVADSKVLSEKKREELYKRAETLKKKHTIDFRVQLIGADIIDEIGITNAVKKGITSGIQSLAPEPRGVHILLDGLLHAPPTYSQETIIRGDATEPVISLASVIAKVSRDRLMCTLAKQFPAYAFEQHKGYGTKAHRNAIIKFGLCEIHRRSFCRTFARPV